MHSPKILCLIIGVKSAFVIILDDNPPLTQGQIWHDLDQLWVFIQLLLVFCDQSLVLCDCWKEGLVSILNHISLLVPIHINTLPHHCLPPTQLDQPSTCHSLTDRVFEGHVEIREYGGVQTMLKLFWSDITCLLGAEPVTGSSLNGLIVQPISRIC